MAAPAADRARGALLADRRGGDPGRAVDPVPGPVRPVGSRPLPPGDRDHAGGAGRGRGRVDLAPPPRRRAGPARTAARAASGPALRVRAVRGRPVPGVGLGDAVPRVVQRPLPRPGQPASPALARGRVRPAGPVTDLVRQQHPGLAGAVPAVPVAVHVRPGRPCRAAADLPAAGRRRAGVAAPAALRRGGCRPSAGRVDRVPAGRVLVLRRRGLHRAASTCCRRCC